MTTDKPDLATVLTHYGWDVRDATGWHSVRCLVHGEKHPSCRINYDLQVIRCMACDFKGDSYTVIMHHEGVNFADAKRIGESQFGAGNSGVRGRHSSSRGVPGRSGHTAGNRSYVPPRLRDTGQRATG